MTVIIFLIVLAILIFVHELGHFLTARAFGIRVDAFALGFGPKLFSWKRGETTYSLNLIPFGGYVKIFGENPDDESLRGPDSKRSFVNKPKWQQVIVLAAGVFFNFIFAWLLYVATFTSGVTATTDGFEKYADRFENERIMVSYVAPGSPAEKAGLTLGDVLKDIKTEGPTETVPIQNIEEIQAIINGSAGTPVMISYTRGSQATTTTLIAVNDIVEGKYAVGIAMADVGDLHLPFFTAIYEAGHYTIIMLRDTAIGLYAFFASIFQGTANFSDVSGPIGIAGIVGNAAEMGFTYLLMITALISINLGIINLVPFPALDGGRIFFILIETVIRRRIPMKFANAVNAVGFSLLMLLMLVVTYKDVVKLFR